MKKYVKKIAVFAGLFLWIATVSMAQKTNQIHVDKNGKKYEWSLSNDGCYGCASFYWKIEREAKPDAEGFYDYTLWFSTNSFYTDKTLTSTYITDITVSFIDEGKEYIAVEPFYVLVPPDMKKSKVFKSKDPAQVIKLTWEPVKLLNK